MAKNIGIIAPIPKHFDDPMSLGGSLSKHGFVRSPGAKRTFLPYKEINSGKYRTGLDENATYLNRLSEQDRKNEITRIKKDRARLEKATGLDLGPFSDYYNFSASVPDNRKVSSIWVSNIEREFNMDNPYEEITFNWLKVHPAIAPSLQKYNTPGSGYQSSQYYVKDDAAEVKIEYNRIKEITKAKIEFDKMSESKRKQVARLMGVFVNEDSKDEEVYTRVNNLLDQSTYSEGALKGRSTVMVFNEISTLSDTLFNVKDLVAQALMYGVYYEKNGAIYEAENRIAENKTELEDRLVSVEAQDERLALEQKIKIKKIV